MAGLSFPLQYRFEPGHERDGVTVQVSLAYLNQLDDMRLEWLVPGLLEEKVTALIKSLPKSRRRLFVPVPDHARKVIAAVPFAKGDLLQEIAAQLSDESGLRIQPDEFNIQALDAHLRFGIELLDDHKKPLAYSRDIQVLQKEFSQSAHASLSSSVSLPYQRTDLSDWPEDLKLPDQEQIRGAVLYPALRAGKHGAEVWLAEDRAEAEMSHREGLMLLFKQQLADKTRYLQKKLPLSARARLTWQGIDSDAKLATDLAGRAIEDLLPDQVYTIRSRQVFQAVLAIIGRQLIARVSELTKILEDALLRYTEVAVSAESCAEQHSEASADMLAQLGYLFYPGMMTEIQPDLLREYPRYLEALRIRQEKLDVNPAKDASMMAAVGGYWQPFMSLYETHQEYPRAMQTLHRLIEEYRVSLFAQSLGTKGKVSPKLLDTALDEARFRLTR